MTGIRIYNKDKKLIIDGTYQNLAFLKKEVSNADKYDGAQYIHNIYIDVPDALMVIDAQNGSSIIYQCNATFRGKTYKIGSRHKIITVYFFGAPKPVNTPKVGLKLHRDGKIIYDSRLQYLKVIGTAYDGLPLDANKQYGLLYRNFKLIVRQQMRQTNNRLGLTGVAGMGLAPKESRIDWWFEYVGLEKRQLILKDIIVKIPASEQPSSMLAQTSSAASYGLPISPDLISSPISSLNTDPRKTTPPLLVDLTGL